MLCQAKRFSHNLFGINEDIPSPNLYFPEEYNSIKSTALKRSVNKSFTKAKKLIKQDDISPGPGKYQTEIRKLLQSKFKISFPKVT